MGSETEESFLVRVEINRIGVLDKRVFINKNFLDFSAIVRVKSALFRDCVQQQWLQNIEK